MIAIDEGLRLWTAYNRRLPAWWRRKAFPLVCFDLPPDGHRAALARAIDALVQASLHDEAYAWATRALPNHPDNPYLHAWLGAACADRGDRVAAAADYRIVVDAGYQYVINAARLAALAHPTSTAAAVDQP